MSAFSYCVALGDLVPFVQMYRLLAWNFTRSHTPPWVFFPFFKLYKWYQILQNMTYTFSARIKISWRKSFSCIQIMTWFTIYFEQYQHIKQEPKNKKYWISFWHDRNRYEVTGLCLRTCLDWFRRVLIVCLFFC